MTCFILHNMTLRDQQTATYDKEQSILAAAAALVQGPAAPPSTVEEPVFSPLRDPAFMGKDFEGVLGALKQMENKGMCHLMQRDLMEHVFLHTGGR